MQVGERLPAGAGDAQHLHLAVRRAGGLEGDHVPDAGAVDAPVTAPPAAEPPSPKGPGGLDTDALRRSWPDVLAKLFEMRRSTWTFVSQNAQVADYDGHRVLLTISTVGLADTFRRGPHAEYVRHDRCGSVPTSTTRSRWPGLRTTSNSLSGHDNERIPPSSISTVGRAWVKS